MKETITKKNKTILPEDFDVVTKYEETIEQSIVDNLFDYFGRTYYKIQNKNDGTIVRNDFISDHDIRLKKFIGNKNRFYSLGILGLVISGIASVLGALLGFNNVTYFQVPYYIVIAIGTLCLCLALFFSGFLLNWNVINNKNKKRINKKITTWNNAFNKFSGNLSKVSIMNALECSIPDFVCDKHTPAYDKKIFNLHNRIYSYADIPQDAMRCEFSNLSSGFYKENAFSLSYSKWEWFREAKVIDKSINDKTKKTKDETKKLINIRRSLKRFEDSICVIAFDTFSDPKLNFVLNNPDGRNIKLQNNIFNNVFSLAVNDTKLAYKIFTPYVQHTLARLKTWTDSSRSIRQVIKEGNKIYVVFDGNKDFFKFDRIVKPELNYVFNTNHVTPSVLMNENKKTIEEDKTKEIKCGSLDETAALMAEYILEETDLMFTALEMGTCYPLDSIIEEDKILNSNSLLDILNEKREDSKKGKFDTINKLNENLSEVPNSPTWNSKKTPMFKPMLKVGDANYKKDNKFSLNKKPDSIFGKMKIKSILDNDSDNDNYVNPSKKNFPF